MSTPSASVLARRRNAAAANKKARDENRLVSNVALDDAGRDARDWLVAHGWTIRAAVSQGLVLLAQREREREREAEILEGGG